MECVFEIAQNCNSGMQNNTMMDNRIMQKGGFNPFDLLYGIFAVLMRVLSGVASTFVAFVPRFFMPPVFYRLNKETGKREFTFPYYPDYLDGYGLFWKFLHTSIKISLYIVVGIYGGISFVFLGMLYLFNRLYKELGVFTESTTKM